MGGKTALDLKDRSRGVADLGGLQSPNESSVIEPALPTRLAPLALWERVPEAKCLVPSTCDDRLPIWAHREVKNAGCMTGQRRDYVQRRIFPYADLVLGRSGGKAVCRDDLMGSERPSEVADLCVCASTSSQFSIVAYTKL
jgi:hypothetical protein